MLAREYQLPSTVRSLWPPPQPADEKPVSDWTTFLSPDELSVTAQFTDFAPDRQPSFVRFCTTRVARQPREFLCWHRPARHAHAAMTCVIRRSALLLLAVRLIRLSSFATKPGHNHQSTLNTIGVCNDFRSPRQYRGTAAASLHAV
jgi:hypothetical protein